MGLPINGMVIFHGYVSYNQSSQDVSRSTFWGSTAPEAEPASSSGAFRAWTVKIMPVPIWMEQNNNESMSVQ